MGRRAGLRHRGRTGRTAATSFSGASSTRPGARCSASGTQEANRIMSPIPCSERTSRRPVVERGAVPARERQPAARRHREGRTGARSCPSRARSRAGAAAARRGPPARPRCPGRPRAPARRPRPHAESRPFRACSDASDDVRLGKIGLQRERALGLRVRLGILLVVEEDRGEVDSRRRMRGTQLGRAAQRRDRVLEPIVVAQREAIVAPGEARIRLGLPPPARGTRAPSAYKPWRCATTARLIHACA